MVRYSLATALLALLITKHQTIGAHADGDHSDPDHTHTEAWSYLPVTIPTPSAEHPVPTIDATTPSLVDPLIVLPELNVLIPV